MTRARLVLAVAAVTAVCAGPGAQAASAPNFTVAIVKSASKSVQAALGYHCTPNPEGTGGACTDATYPLVSDQPLVVRPHRRVQVLLGAPAADVAWAFMGLDKAGQETVIDYGRTHRLTKTAKRWEVRLPAEVSSKVKILRLEVFYPNAYSSFEAGVRRG